jgi:hypothetical protein
MPPKKYMTVEEGAALLRQIGTAQAEIEVLKGDVGAANIGIETLEEHIANVEPQAAAVVSVEKGAMPKLNRLDCFAYDGDAVVKMTFTSDREAVKAINSLRRKVLASGINVVCGDTVTCFRHLTRVVFAAELARDFPLLMKQ